MRSMKKIFIGILFLMILCLSPLGREQGYAATETADGAVGIKAEYTSLEKMITGGLQEKKDLADQIQKCFWIRVNRHVAKIVNHLATVVNM